MNLRPMRREDPRTTSHKELLDLVQRYYDQTGDPFVKPMIARAHEALGYVPGNPNSEKPTLHLSAGS